MALDMRNGDDSPDAITARETQILGAPQRVTPMDEGQLDQASRDVVLRVRTAIGLPATAKLPDYCQTMIRHPEIFRCQMDFGAVIFQGDLPPRERELAVLRIGWLLLAPYEWGEHVDISKRYGVTEVEIERVIQGSSAPGWSDHDAAILRAVEELLTDQSISDDTWAALTSGWTEKQMIEFTVMVGQYVAHALIQNALRIRLEANNPGLTHR